MMAVDWRPIETAPKDGTRVLVFCEGEIFLAQWGACDDPNHVTWHSDRVGPGYEDAYEDATHWMPLPPRPEAR